MSVYETRRRADRAAKEALQQFGAVELSDMPVDATQFAEFFDTEVFIDDLDAEELDGFVLIENGRAEITINANQALHRRRFTCAHELGHVFDHRETKTQTPAGFLDDLNTLIPDENEAAVTKFRDERSRSGTSTEEIYANQFAAAVLMPEHLVRTLHSIGQSVNQMARFFAVSQTAMRYRLANLDLK